MSEVAERAPLYLTVEEAARYLEDKQTWHYDKEGAR